MAIDSGEKTYLSHTAQQVDDAIDAVATKANASDLTAETTARQNADAKHLSALQGLIDGGAKNRLPYTLASLKSMNIAGEWISNNVYYRRGIYYTVNSDLTITATGTNDATGDSWLDIYGSGTTSDFVGMVCSGCPEGGASDKYGIQCGNNNWDYGTSDGRVCVQGPIAIVIRSGQGTSTGLLFKPMICTVADWNISHEFVPYCPTNAELYQMILALQQ